MSMWSKGQKGKQPWELYNNFNNNLHVSVYGCLLNASAQPVEIKRGTSWGTVN